MHRPLAAIAVLCICAQGAFAQCVAPGATATANPAAHPTSVSEPVHAISGNAPTQGAARPELIKTAAAGTRDDGPTVMREGTRDPNGQDHPRRGGTAMLLAALAL